MRWTIGLLVAGLAGCAENHSTTQAHLAECAQQNGFCQHYST